MCCANHYFAVLTNIDSCPLFFFRDQPTAATCLVNLLILYRSPSGGVAARLPPPGRSGGRVSRRWIRYGFRVVIKGTLLQGAGRGHEDRMWALMAYRRISLTTKRLLCCCCAHENHKIFTRLRENKLFVCCAAILENILVPEENYEK